MTGCRCPECFGLAEYMLTVTGKDYGLPAAPGCVPVIAEPCKDTLDCDCSRCETERREWLQAKRRRPAAQPWDVRKAA